MELRQLRYFVTVAKELHFGRAAERLHIVQPAVSQQVRRLERELGITLFDRTPRTVRLTEAGRPFLPEARAVLAAEDRARRVAAELAATRTGTLRLGTSEGLGDHLARVLDAFGRLAPTVAVELVSASTRTRLDRVRAGLLDAAFVRGVTAGPGDADLDLWPVWEDPLVVALPAGRPAAAGEAVDLAALADLPLRLVARSRNPPLVDLVRTACRAAGFEPVAGPPFTTMQDTLAAIGTGPPSWTVVYAAHARLLPAPRVAFRPVGPPGLRMPTALAVSRSAPPACLPELLAACASDHDS